MVKAILVDKFIIVTGIYVGVIYIYRYINKHRTTEIHTYAHM